MPKWLAPFHRPRLSGEEFAAAKAAYVAKYGYTITVPGLSDIILLGVEKPITPEEELQYHRKNWFYFSPERLEDIRRMKKKRKDRYLAMLGSPTPQIAQNAGSILTSLDDCQDALSTIGVIGSFIAFLAPRAMARIIGGPVVAVMAFADILNWMQRYGRMTTMATTTKRTHNAATGNNPLSKKARVRRAARLKQFSLSTGNLIEALQVSADIFGIGVSLGPVMGLASDLFFGTVRTTFGMPPNIVLPTPDFPWWYRAAQKITKGIAALWGALWHTDDDMLLEAYVATFLAYQELSHFQQEWNPLDMIERPQDLLIQAPVPTNILTREVIDEGEIPMDQVVGWPHSGKLWANIGELAQETQPVATQNLKNFMERNKYSWRGFVGGALATETGFNCLSCLEGEDQVEYDYTVPVKAASIMLENGLYPDPGQPPEKIDAFASWLDFLERTAGAVSMRNISMFCQQNQISLVSFP